MPQKEVPIFCTNLLNENFLIQFLLPRLTFKVIGQQHSYGAHFLGKSVFPPLFNFNLQGQPI